MRPDSCPARSGNGADIDTAEFRFFAEPCHRGPDGQHTLVEIVGYFCPPGQDTDQDVLLTAELTVPADSPIAAIARKVARDPEAIRKVGEHLRHRVGTCQCASHEQCPALSAHMVGAPPSHRAASRHLRHSHRPTSSPRPL